MEFVNIENETKKYISILKDYIVFKRESVSFSLKRKIYITMNMLRYIIPVMVQINGSRRLAI